MESNFEETKLLVIYVIKKLKLQLKYRRMTNDYFQINGNRFRFSQFSVNTFVHRRLQQNGLLLRNETVNKLIL